ncbi:dihydrolipoyllysine-residue succinyltransferase [Flavobacteriaceae bacterium UJ101]|nr:dihydrolipoyllysine-residue succinyltransferase [Flavobacteriaceae bacterium UJ101]
MAEYKIVLPELGEGVIEATLTNWLVNVGDKVEEDDSIAEIATDKVDSDVPTSRDGVVKELLYQPNDVIKVGAVLAILEVEGEVSEEEVSTIVKEETAVSEEIIETVSAPLTTQNSEVNSIESSEDRFYSPLVKNIAKEENISQSELDSIKGSGAKGRVTKDDILDYLKNRGKNKDTKIESVSPKTTPTPRNSQPTTNYTFQSGDDEIIEMDRMRKMIANHMVDSKRISPHVSSFVEADLTKIVNWRNKIKDEFLRKEGEKMTFTPIFIQAVARAIKDYPMINVQVDGDKIIRKKDINIGMAVALPSGNLIVPVIKNADQYSLTGLAKKVNDIANRARNNQLKPDEIKGGTYTVTNIGSFGNVFGTPIINQPQAAILAVGAIVKKPAVIETPEGDVIGIRHKMFLSHSYDHRVVDGALGGMFVKRVGEYLESFNETI